MLAWKQQGDADLWWKIHFTVPRKKQYVVERGSSGELRASLLKFLAAGGAKIAPPVLGVTHKKYFHGELQSEKDLC